MEPHVTPELLLGIAEGRIPEEAGWRTALRHLQSRCASCNQTLEELALVVARRLRTDRSLEPGIWRLGRLGVLDPREVCSRSFRQARRDLEVLRPLSPTERLARFSRARVRFRTAAHVEVLLEEAHRCERQGSGDPLAWLDLAREIAVWLHAVGYRPEVANTYILRVRAQRANASRVAGDLLGADALLRRLREDALLDQVAEAEVLAHFDSLEASLRRDQRRFEEAERLLGSAERLYRTAGCLRGVAAARLKRGAVRSLAGDSQAALEDFRSAGELLHDEPESELYLSVQHGLALCLCELDRPGDAAEIVDRHRDLYARFPGLGIEGPLSWLRGRVARGLGRLGEAEAQLRDALDRYLAHERGYDAALVCLDLAELHLDQGRTADVRELARAMMPTFETRNIHREAFAALLLFQEAAAAERLGTALIGRLRNYLRQAQRDPRFAFDAEGS